MTPHMTATELYWKLSAVTSGDMVFPEAEAADIELIAKALIEAGHAAEWMALSDKEREVARFLMTASVEEKADE